MMPTVKMLSFFCSEDAYDAWAPAPDGSGGNYVDIVFDAENDRGILGERVENLEIDVPNHYAITSGYQWTIMQDFSDNLICIGVDYGFEIDDPNKSNAMIGLVYPWAKRPVLIERLDEFDYYDYGEDQEAWSEDDNYVYYGANVAESCFLGTILQRMLIGMHQIRLEKTLTIQRCRQGTCLGILPFLILGIPTLYWLIVHTQTLGQKVLM